MHFGQGFWTRLCIAIGMSVLFVMIITGSIFYKFYGTQIISFA
jgi:hypothetical protein